MIEFKKHTFKVCESVFIFDISWRNVTFASRLLSDSDQVYSNGCDKSCISHGDETLLCVQSFVKCGLEKYDLFEKDGMDMVGS